VVSSIFETPMGRRTLLEIFDVPIDFSAGDREAMTR